MAHTNMAFCLQFSTAAAWATRQDRLHHRQDVGADAARNATPPPAATPPPDPAGCDDLDATAMDTDTAAGTTHKDDDVRAGNEYDGAVAEDHDDHGSAGHGAAMNGSGSFMPSTSTAEGTAFQHSYHDTPSTPTRPDEYENAHAGAMQHEGNQASLPTAVSFSEPASLVAAGSASFTSTTDTNMLGPELRSVASITSAPVAAAIAAATTQQPPPAAAMGGIDWAAIKNEALRHLPNKRQAGGVSNTNQEGHAGNTGTADDDAPYQPDDGSNNEPEHDTMEASAADDVPDLSPVVAKRPLGVGPFPGQTAWQGRFNVPGSGSFTGDVTYLGGLGPLDAMLGSPESEVEVMGRVALDKFEQFMDDLRGSKSRTVSLGVVSYPETAEPMEMAYMQEVIKTYSAKNRIGRLALSSSALEGYLVAKSGEQATACA